jgi:predicted hydrocarbon binding protein
MNTNKKVTPSRYFKAYLRELPNKDGEIESQVQCLFSKKPFSSEQFMSLIMGVMEAYAEQLLTNNTPETVYDNFNHAFGIFLAKLVPQEYIYEHSEEHKKFMEHVEETLGKEADLKDTEDNRFAAYLLCHDILTKEVGLDHDSANLILNRRLGTLRTDGEETK